MTHNLDDLLTVLLEAYKETINDSRVSEQIDQQMDTHVLQGVAESRGRNRQPRQPFPVGRGASVCGL